MATTYYIQAENHIFSKELGKTPVRIGMVTPKRGRTPLFNKAQATEITEEQARKYLKGKGMPYISGVLSPKPEPMVSVTSPVTVYDRTPSPPPPSRSKIFNDIVSVQNEARRLHKEVLSLLRTGTGYSDLPENIRQVLTALYMAGNIEIKDPPDRTPDPNGPQFDDTGILEFPAH